MSLRTPSSSSSSGVPGVFSSSSSSTSSSTEFYFSCIKVYDKILATEEQPNNEEGFQVDALNPHLSSSTSLFPSAHTYTNFGPSAPLVFPSSSSSFSSLSTSSPFKEKRVWFCFRTLKLRNFCQNVSKKNANLIAVLMFIDGMFYSGTVESKHMKIQEGTFSSSTAERILKLFKGEDSTDKIKLIKTEEDYNWSVYLKIDEYGIEYCIIENVILKSLDFEKAICLIFSAASTDHKIEREEINKLEEENKKIKNLLNETQSELQNFVDNKRKVEDEYLQKFALILNEKKKKLKEYRDRYGYLEDDPKSGVKKEIDEGASLKFGKTKGDKTLKRNDISRIEVPPSPPPPSPLPRQTVDSSSSPSSSSSRAKSTVAASYSHRPSHQSPLHSSSPLPPTSHASPPTVPPPPPPVAVAPSSRSLLPSLPAVEEPPPDSERHDAYVDVSSLTEFFSSLMPQGKEEEEFVVVTDQILIQKYFALKRKIKTENASHYSDAKIKNGLHELSKSNKNIEKNEKYYEEKGKVIQDKNDGRPGEEEEVKEKKKKKETQGGEKEDEGESKQEKKEIKNKRKKSDEVVEANQEKEHVEKEIMEKNKVNKQGDVIIRDAELSDVVIQDEVHKEGELSDRPPLVTPPATPLPPVTPPPRTPFSSVSDVSQTSSPLVFPSVSPHANSRAAPSSSAIHPSKKRDLSSLFLLCSTPLNKQKNKKQKEEKFKKNKTEDEGRIEEDVKKVMQEDENKKNTEEEKKKKEPKEEEKQGGESKETNEETSKKKQETTGQEEGKKEDTENKDKEKQGEKEERREKGKTGGKRRRQDVQSKERKEGGKGKERNTDTQEEKKKEEKTHHANVLNQEKDGDKNNTQRKNGNNNKKEASEITNETNSEDGKRKKRRHSQYDPLKLLTSD